MDLATPVKVGEIREEDAQSYTSRVMGRSLKAEVDRGSVARQNHQ